MPKFNSRGDYLAGVGGTQGSRNLVVYPFPTDGGGAWLTDDTIIVQRASDHVLVTVDAVTLNVISVLQPPRGANSLSAGGGQFIAGLSPGGIYGDVGGLPFPNGAGVPLNAVGQDGTRVYTPNAQMGYGFHGINADGSTFDVPQATPYDVQVLGPNTVLWQRGAFGRAVPRPALADANGLLLVPYKGQDWLLYWSESTGVVLQPDGGTEGWVLDTRPMEFGRDIVVIGDAIRIVWSVTAGERPQDVVVCEIRNTGVTYPVKATGWQPQVAVWKPLTPPPAEPIGPRSEPVAAGTPIEDLLPYVVGKPKTWPRKGPSHTMGQVAVKPGIWAFVKFAGNEPTLANGQAYELWAWNDYWTFLLEDASGGGGNGYSFTDPRMWPRQLKVGEAHAFTLPPHEAVWHDRSCKETRREPFGRRMWCHRLWPKFYWGPDLGERATAMLVYDDTGGFHIEGRYIEVGYYVLGAGSCRWEAYASWLLYPPGATEAQFTDAARVQQKDFYLIGGPNPGPTLTGCVPQTVPDYGPITPPVVEPYYRAKEYRIG